MPLDARTPFSIVIIAGMSYGPFSKISYADPGICVIGGQGPDLFLVFSPRLILQFTEGVQLFYCRENYPLPRLQRRSNIFKGVQLFSWGGGGGLNAYFYRNPYNV